MSYPLVIGAYQARSIITAAQRCVNLYLEKAPAGEQDPTTHLPTPGLVKLATLPTQGFRGLFSASNGALYAVVGPSLYRIQTDWSATRLGDLGSDVGPVSMADNSVTLVIVDGTNRGYTIDLKTDAFGEVFSEAFYGSPRVDEMDDFLVFSQPNTRQFYVSGALALTFDPLDIAAKNGASDKTVAIGVVNRMLWVFGERTTEIWYNSGSADFVFARYPGVFIQHGCAAAASIARADTSLYWLGSNDQGGIAVFRSNQMAALMISTDAISKEFATYARVDDAIGYTHMIDGHVFYVLTFPTADKTWVYDLSTQQWHERLWMDESGDLHRHRGSCFASWNGVQLVGDWQTGDLYQLSTDAYDDAGVDMLHVRTWPCISNEGNQVYFEAFEAVMEVGNSAVTDQEPQVRLRWSNDRGRSWGNKVSRGLGKRGEFGKKVYWRGLGRSEHRVFELTWSARVKTALSVANITASSRAIWGTRQAPQPGGANG